MSSLNRFIESFSRARPHVATRINLCVFLVRENADRLRLKYLRLITVIAK